MRVVFDPSVKKFLKRLSRKERAKVTEYLDLFTEYKFELDARYLKKVTQMIWELRPGSLRLFFFIKYNNQIIIHAMKKKSQRITKKTITTLEQKMKEYV